MASLARGRSGGLVTMWDPNVFVKKRMCHPGKVILFGDLNEVRNDSKRFGSIFSSVDAAIFNDFIQESGLIDLPMRGRSFTRMNKEFVVSFFSSGKFPQGVNSAFITLIPKVSNPLFIKDYRPISLIGRIIIDGPLILSEIIDWYKKRKKKLMLFEVDFEKAFNSVTRTYILINGIPTLEFSLKRGLRQGNPLSPFLFIIVMEGLRMALNDGIASNMFHRVRIGSNIHLSHLFYADDVIIISDWNQNDMENITRILNIFYVAFGLKINFHKSNVFEVGVSNSEVVSMSICTGCEASSFPFSYLGLPIGSNTSQIANWQILIDRFKAILSGWKTNLISISGRLTLIKSMLGSLGIYYFSIFKAPKMVIKSFESLRANFFWGIHESSKKLSWVKWPNTIASFDKGGLGVGSLSTFNKALLLKWRWRLFNFLNSLWVQLEMVLLSAFGRILGLEMIHFISDIIDYFTLKTIKIASLVNVFLMVHGNGIGVGLLLWEDPRPNLITLSSTSNMSRIANWHILIDRFKARLSGWKANLISIGGRLTLIKSVLRSLGIFHFSIFKAPEMVIKSLESLRANFHESSKKLSWVKWSNTLASFDKGGLGGSLSAFNIALLLKWRWRLFNFPNSLWVQVIKDFHGNETGIDLGGCQTSGTWAKIVGTINHLHSSGIVPLNSIRFKVGDGSSIRFWKDTWLGNDPLYIRYNRLFHLENNKDYFISQRILNGSWEWDWCRPITMGRSTTEFDNLIIDISNMEIDDLAESDTCVWSLSNDDSFSVNSVRKHIDEHSLPSLFPCTRRYKMIPKKQDKRDSRPGDSDGISKSPDCVNALPIVTGQTKEVVTKSSIRHSKCSPDDLRSSGASPKGDDATLYKDEYVSQGEDFVDFNQLLDSNQYNNPEGSVLRRFSRQHKMPARFDNYELDKKIRYDTNVVDSYAL
nr:RNA-directed DNA polymerase, eukaryota, reverse transcriptase zinc-binding domain protein [Tanacetum cinerariifolium]